MSAEKRKIILETVESVLRNAVIEIDKIDDTEVLTYEENAFLDTLYNRLDNHLRTAKRLAGAVKEEG